MGWWKISSTGDDLLGDSPADAAYDLLEAVRDSCTERGAPKPTLQQLLDAMASLLRESPGLYLANGDALERVAITETATGTVARAEDASADLFEPLRRGLAEINEVYEESLERKPRLLEVFAAVSFVLRPETEAYLSTAVPDPLLDIVPVPLAGRN